MDFSLTYQKIIVLSLFSSTLLHAAEGALPDLPESQDRALGKINWAYDGASLGFETATEQLIASVDYSASNKTAFNFDAGFALSDYFALGANFEVSERFQNALLTGVFSAPDHLRLRLSAGQQQAQNELDTAFNSPRMRQNNYLLSLKKGSSYGSFFSELGVTVYAADPKLENESIASENTGGMYFDSRMATGKRQGAIYNLSLSPIHNGKLDFGLAYQREKELRGMSFGETARSTLVQYSQYFSNCLRLTGAYNGGENSHLFNVRIANDAWSLNASRALEQENGSVVLRYAIPLSGGGVKNTSCMQYGLEAKPLPSVLKELTKRPGYLPTLSAPEQSYSAQAGDKSGLYIDASNRQFIQLRLLMPIEAVISLQTATVLLANSSDNILWLINDGALRLMLRNFRQAGTYIFDVQQSDGAILQIEVVLKKAKPELGGAIELVSARRLNFPTPTGVQNMSPQQFSRVPASELALFNAEQLRVLSPLHLGALLPVQLAVFSALPTLSIEQLAGLAPPLVLMLSPAQLMALSLDQLAGLNALDVEFSPQQRAVLPAATLAGFELDSKILGDEPFIISPPQSNSQGPLRYTSSHPEVAMVEESTGEVTLVGAGHTVIEAQQAAKGVYTSARVSAVLKVLPPLIGENNLPSLTGGF
ncbi:hypothetical protein R6242_06500 [Iodobacter sp. CM08]|uniref:hypothetical protein n=1 Tax=Iodobacter sp. CM08 TaxID=3085902 RepID=UPI0029824F8D|nr:hypothetical protein [Iodobacter sp. CM08]MDW5416222.1 hypothetical protein [Iodobacter sp. CM08]